MTRYTVAEIAEALQVEKDTARGLVRFLEEIGEAQNMGTRPASAGKGRAENVYELSEGFEVRLCDFLEDARLTD